MSHTLLLIIMPYLAIVILCLLSFPALIHASDSDELWFGFWNKDNSLIGYRDAEGNQTIAPRFMGLTGAKKFRNIIAVMEENDGNYRSYYLLKNGQQIGEGDTYMSDMSFDCEKEGKIRFRERATDKVGFFDKGGKSVIPASYSDARPFSNGMAVVLKGAVRSCDNGKPFTEQNRCEHWFWKGGETLLINDSNQVLIDGFDDSFDLNLYSMLVTDIPPVSSIRKVFTGRNAKYYSFEKFEDEFKVWLGNDFLSSLNKANIVTNSHKNISIFDEEKGWVFTAPDEISEDYMARMIKELTVVRDRKVYYFFSKGDLNEYIFNLPEYDKYYDDCGESRSDRNPVMALVINHESEDDFIQNQISFLRTDKGYKLISVTLRSEEK